MEDSSHLPRENSALCHCLLVYFIQNTKVDLLKPDAVNCSQEWEWLIVYGHNIQLGKLFFLSQSFSQGPHIDNWVPAYISLYHGSASAMARSIKLLNDTNTLSYQVNRCPAFQNHTWNLKCPKLFLIFDWCLFNIFNVS